MKKTTKLIVSKKPKQANVPSKKKVKLKKKFEKTKQPPKKKKPIQRNTKKFKYHYDEEQGIFIREGEISVNWLISEVLEEDLQITKATNEEIQKFLYLLDTSDLRMPDGKHSLFWLKEKLEEKKDMAEGKLGEVWAIIAERYYYILEQISFTLVKSGNIKEKKEIRKEEKKEIYREPSNMKASFEPL